MQFLKTILDLLARLVAVPVWAGTGALMRVGDDPDRWLAWTSQWISTWPGPLGEYARRAVYGRLLERCPPDVCICHGTVFSRRGARIGNRAYLGVGCNIGLVDLGDDCLLGSGVHLLSGKNQHFFQRTDVPIREQGGEFSQVRIGRGTWIGNAAVVMADVGRECVVGAGSVVVRPVPDGALVGGNPARVLGFREGFEPREDVLATHGSSQGDV